MSPVFDEIRGKIALQQRFPEKLAAKKPAEKASQPIATCSSGRKLIQVEVGDQLDGKPGGHFQLTAVSSCYLAELSSNQNLLNTEPLLRPQ